MMITVLIFTVSFNLSSLTQTAQANTTGESTEDKQHSTSLPPYKKTLPINVDVETKQEIHWGNADIINYYDRIEDVRYTYEIDTKPKSYLKVTKRRLDNGDQFIFTTLENHSDNAVDVKVSISIANTGYYSLKSFDQYMTGPRSNSSIHVDLTTGPLGLLTTYKDKAFNSNVMVGKQYHSKELTKNYQDGRRSVLRELINEDQGIDIDAQKNDLNLVIDMESKGNDMVDHWLLYSDESLFESDASYKEWIRIYNNKKYKNNNWYTADGPYRKVGRTAEPKPESELQYARNLLIVREDEPLKRYKETEERYFYNLLLNSITNLAIFKGDDEFYETEYTNRWLNRAYGIEPPYIDTRHNEGVALFLEETGEILDIPEIQKALTNYADLLVNQINTGQVVEVGPNASLISDYFTFNQDDVGVTHSSLNHVLGGMNLLLQTYNDTGEKKYLTAATYVQNGIDALGDKWLTDEGDTWYQISPDHTFSGEDYPRLTLNDLLLSLELWEGIDSSRTQTLEMLIKSKANYLANNDISFTKEMIASMKKHGFGEIIQK